HWPKSATGTSRENKRLNCLLILELALILCIGVNEQTPRSSFELCPICTARVPFSLAMHMVAAHSANALENSVDSRSVTFREAQASAHRPSRPRHHSRSKRLHAAGRGF